MRQHTSAYSSIRQHTSAYVSIRQHTSAYVSIRQRHNRFRSCRHSHKHELVSHSCQQPLAAYTLIYTGLDVSGLEVISSITCPLLSKNLMPVSILRQLYWVNYVVRWLQLLHIVLTFSDMSALCYLLLLEPPIPLRLARCHLLLHCRYRRSYELLSCRRRARLFCSGGGSSSCCCCRLSGVSICTFVPVRASVCVRWYRQLLPRRQTHTRMPPAHQIWTALAPT
jgi:hypothetical protein